MSENTAPMSLIEQGIRELTADNANLRESLEQVQMMFKVEDQNWTRLFGGLSEDFPGLSLEQVKQWTEQVQEYEVGNPYIKRGSALRSNYTWSKGVNIPGSVIEPSKTGRKTALQRFCNHPRTQAYLLSAEAHGEMERSAFSSGTYMVVGNDRSKTLEHPVSILEIDAILTNPDYIGEIWAYLRVWDQISPDGTTEQRKQWYYTDRFDGVRKKSIKSGQESIPVAQDRTLFDQTFNSQVGWPLGIPDALAAIVWARIYSEMVNHGKVMTESLAKFAFKVTQATPKGASNVGAQVNKPGAGKAAVLGTANDLVPLSSAGKVYQFRELQPILAAVATSLEVSIVHLTSDPGSAGSSYGSASNLDLPTKKAVVARQNLWRSYLKRVLEWATDAPVEVAFPPLDDDIYRAIQSLALIWNTGTVHPDELRDAIVDLGGILSKHDDVPDGILVPNNEHSWERTDIDSPGEIGTTAASPDQGRSNGAGDQGADKNDERTDNVSEMLKQFQNDAFMEKLESLVERIESASSGSEG